MTPNGRQCLEILVRLANRNPSHQGWFTASEVTEHFPDLPDRQKPVMTVSSYLTHLKRFDLVERRQSSDKNTAWWKPTRKGIRKLDVTA